MAVEPGASQSPLEPDCPQKYIPADTVNAAVEQYFYTLELVPERIEELRTLLHDGIDLALRAHGKQTQHHRNRLVQLERERDKLLHLFYEDAIETDQLKKEQNRIKKEKGAATRAINAMSGTRDEILAKLDRVLEEMRTCGHVYKAAGYSGRRRMLAGTMEAVFIRDEEIIGATMQSLIESLHDQQKIEGIGREITALRSATEDDLNRAYRALVSKTKNHDPVEDRGSNIRLLVGPIGFEPGLWGVAVVSSETSLEWRGSERVTPPCQSR